MISRDISYVDVPGGSYIKHHLSPSVIAFRTTVGAIAILAMLTLAFVFWGMIAMSVVQISVHIYAENAGFVPDWMGYLAICFWSMATLACVLGTVRYMIGKKCLKLIDWANGREPMTPMYD